MKNLIQIFAVAAICVASSTTYSQCCPYVDPIEILPAAPFDTDSIYVVTNVTTPNMGIYLGYNIIELGSVIRIEACYYSGMLTALQTYTDTINLGLLDGGNYTIEFVAYQSDDDQNCNPTDSNSVSSTVTVISTLSDDILENINTFNVYPNPVNNGVLFLSNSAEIPFQIVNTTGQTVLEGTVSKEGTVDVSALVRGLYYISLLHGDAVETTSIMVE